MMSAYETRKHYNREVDLFRSFLDPYMKYTSGLYLKGDESLETACVSMLDKIIEVAALPQTANVLEIGCGWGALLKRLREVRSVSDVHYLGISPSERQNAFINETICSQAELHCTTFETWNAGERRYDAIFSIGSFCHLEDKRSQLLKMASLLKPGGKIIIEDTFFVNEACYLAHQGHRATRFVQTELFGFAHITSFSAFACDIEAAGLRLNYCLEHSNSYKKTLDEWISRLRRLSDYNERLDLIKGFRVAQRGLDRTILNHLVVLGLSTGGGAHRHD